jgi:predicted ribosomally synthesized peptide with SipW-like signal peptide
MCVALLITSTYLFTTAYLSDSAEVVNTFTVGKVDISLDEVKVNEKGEPVGDEDGDGENDRTTEGNKYHLIPGKKYEKDPTLYLEKGSEDAYIRMLVTLNCYKELSELYEDEFYLQYFVEGWNPEIWQYTNKTAVDEEANTIAYEFRYHKTCSAKDEKIALEALFTQFVVPAQLTGAELQTLNDFKMSVEGHAIQKSGFDDADTAWQEFKKN